MKLSPDDRKWMRRMVRDVLAEVIRTEATHGGYDGATDVTEDDDAEQGKRRQIGFVTPRRRRKKR